ncbi:MAG: ABC transporter ATP-binding protein, partial [Candidatus Orphnella occulta]|nr:ABC transporter ATP-binding protein [Candidatus Orphnella occulta]
MNAIDFKGVWEKYRIKFIDNKRVSWEEIWALSDISLNVKKGDVIGIIGKNGAGKTTLLKLIAGMLMPDRGSVSVNGKVSALMELGAGFNPEFTGIENIDLNTAVYGFGEDDLSKKKTDIVEFANLGKFINAPIKYYSQGMYMRLAFAMAIFANPDILLIDDIIAVGDEQAQQKCNKKIFELKDTGKTVVLVTHNMDVISKLCNRIILMDKGKIIQEDLTSKVVPYYLETIGNEKGIAVLKKDQFRIIFNNGKVTLNYNDFPLTETTGGHTPFFIPSLNSWFSSSNLFWQIKSLEADKIIAEGRSCEGILSQTWTLQIEKHCLQWRIEINDKTIKQQHTDLLLVPQYKRWTALNSGDDFPLFASKSNWHDLGVNNCPEAILGLSGSWQEQGYPGLILEQEDRENTFKIFNTGYEQEARVIQWSLDSQNKNLISIKLFSEEGQFAEYIEKAKQKFFKKEQEEQKRLLQKQKQEQARLRVQRTLVKGDLRLYADVDAKALRLFYKDAEITEGIGLHSSFLIKSTWHDLIPCKWQMTRKKDSLILRLYWEELKSKQVWRFFFKDNTLSWHVDLE